MTPRWVAGCATDLCGNGRQYRNAVASGPRSRLMEIPHPDKNPTLPRYGTDSTPT